MQTDVMSDESQVPVMLSRQFQANTESRGFPSSSPSVYTQVHNVLISMQAQRCLIGQYARHELNLNLSIYVQSGMIGFWTWAYTYNQAWLDFEPEHIPKKYFWVNCPGI